MKKNIKKFEYYWEAKFEYYWEATLAITIEILIPLLLLSPLVLLLGVIDSLI